MKRPKQHKIDSRAQKIFANNCPDNWSLSEPSNDYGLDYLVQVFEDNEIGESTKISFFIQLKGTEKYKQNNTHVKFQMKTDTLEYYFTKVSLPVFLVVVDVTSENYCWLFLQEYINEELEVKNPSWKSQKTITLDIPKENTFSNPEIIGKYASEGLSYCNLLVNGIPTKELEWKVKNITNNPSKKLKDIKNSYSKLYNDETKIGFELIHNDNNLIDGKKAYESVYDKTKGDSENILPHLNSIIGLIPFYEWQNEDEVGQLFKFIEEGFKLAKQNRIYHLEYYFYGCHLEKSFYILQNELDRLLLTKRISETQNNILSGLIGITLDEPISEIFQSLSSCYDHFSKNLMKALDNGEIFIFIELLRMLINIQIYQTKIIRNSSEENLLKSLFNHIIELINIFEGLINFSEDFEIFRYDLYVFKITYYFFIDDEKYNQIIEDYINYSKKNNSKYHMQRADDLKKQFNIPLKRTKKIEEMSDEEIFKFYRTVILAIEGIDISTDTSDDAFVLKTAVEDLNPKRILDNCSNLELIYGSCGIYAPFFGLHANGMKMLYCEHGGITSDLHLDHAYQEFHKKYCMDCKHKSEQDFKWNPDKLNYVKSDKFKEIINKHPIFSLPR